MNHKILIISYITGTGGSFLDYFLMNHKEIFYKGYITIDRNNEYWSILRNDNNNYQRRWSLRTAKQKSRFINEVATITEDTIFRERTYKIDNCKYITTGVHLIEERCIYNDNAILLGIYVDDDVIPYIKSLIKLKFTGAIAPDGEYIDWIESTLGDGFNEHYLKCMNSETVPTYFINYKSFFINQEVTEYIRLCDFLNIPPDVEMYKKAIDYYMYMNNKLLKEGGFCEF